MFEFSTGADLRSCPCKRDCPDRDATCHGSCEKYLKWQSVEAQKSKERRIQDEQYIMSDTKRAYLQKKYRKNGRKNSPVY